MKRLRFNELLLLSMIEKRARRIPFDPEVTVIQGENATGKSSIIKSVFATFGAEPPVNPRWADADAQSLVKFNIDEKPFAILRSFDKFALFDGSRTHIATFRRVTAEWGPTFARLVDFKLQLADKKGTPQTPPPAFFFLPYYIDQDSGWNATLASFTKLQQFARWRKHVVEYHTGIRPNEYYEKRAAMHEAEASRSEPAVRERVLREIQRDLRSRLESVSFDIDIGSFKNVIDRLMDRAQLLKQSQDKYRSRIVDLRNERDELLAQKGIVSRTKGELRADYSFAAAEESGIKCPLCGSEYHNTFVERFAIARDENRCDELLLEISHRLDRVERKIADEEEALALLKIELGEVENLLAEKKGEVTFKEFIDHEGKKGFRKALEEDLARVAVQLGEIDGNIRALKEGMDKVTSPERRQEVSRQYVDLMADFLSDLGVHGYQRRYWEKIEGEIKHTGSELPRAVLAKALAMWHLMADHTSTAFAPLVVDALNQQEQDEKSLKRILETLRDRRPKGSQLILGTVSTEGVEFPGTRVTMTDKYAALTKNEFTEVGDEMREYMSQVQ